jgi:hypothetical protein
MGCQFHTDDTAFAELIKTRLQPITYTDAKERSTVNRRPSHFTQAVTFYPSTALPNTSIPSFAHSFYAPHPWLGGWQTLRRQKLGKCRAPSSPPFMKHLSMATVWICTHMAVCVIPHHAVLLAVSALPIIS